MKTLTREELEVLTKKLNDEGKIIEAGFLGLRLAAMDPAAGEVQLNEARMSFFAGAAHLFSSIMTILDPGEEATEQDFRRLSLIQAELDAFIADYELKHLPAQGRA